MSNNVAIVTGGASGIGLATCEHLLSKGWRVVIADLNQEIGLKVTKELGPESTFVQTNVTSFADQVAMFKHALNWGGRIDLFAANAGIDDKQDMHLDAEGDQLDEHGNPKPLDLTAIDVDLTAVIQGCWLYRHYARRNPQPGGKIVITASIAGLYASPINPQYCTAKAACIALTRCLGPRFLKTANITVNAICPGLIMTSLCPPEIRALFPKDQITPMETALRAYDTFLDDPSLTGQTVELSIEKIIFRKQVEYANENQRWLLEDAMDVWKQAYGE